VAAGSGCHLINANGGTASRLWKKNSRTALVNAAGLSRFGCLAAVLGMTMAEPGSRPLQLITTRRGYHSYPTTFAGTQTILPGMRASTPGHSKLPRTFILVCLSRRMQPQASQDLDPFCGIRASAISHRARLPITLTLFHARLPSQKESARTSAFKIYPAITSLA